MLAWLPELALSQTSTLNQKSYRIQWNTRYFQSYSKINYQGGETPYREGESFSRWDNDIELAYGLNERLEPSIGLRYRLNHSIHTPTSYQGMESFWFQIKYRIPFSSRFQLITDARFRQTAYKENKSDNNVLLGDPGNESEWGTHIVWFPNSQISWSLYLGYRRPPNQLSEEIPWQLEFLWQKKRQGLGLGIEGLVSLKTDPYPIESRRPKQSFTGGTKLYNSFNRQWFKPYLAAGFALSPHWKMSLKASRSMQVLSGDTGWGVGLGLSRTSRGITPRQKKIQAFKEYSMEATVVQVSPKQHFVQIDQGLNADISKGMKFDIYSDGFSDENKLLASGIAWKVLSKKSIIRIFKRYTKKKIKPGTIARGY